MNKGAYLHDNVETIAYISLAHNYLPVLEGCRFKCICNGEAFVFLKWCYTLRSVVVQNESEEMRITEDRNFL